METLSLTLAEDVKAVLEERAMREEMLVDDYLGRLILEDRERGRAREALRSGAGDGRGPDLRCRVKWVPWRWSLRTLLLLVAVASLLFGVFGLGKRSGALLQLAGSHEQAAAVLRNEADAEQAALLRDHARVASNSGGGVGYKAGAGRPYSYAVGPNEMVRYVEIARRHARSRLEAGHRDRLAGFYRDAASRPWLATPPEPPPPSEESVRLAAIATMIDLSQQATRGRVLSFRGMDFRDSDLPSLLDRKALRRLDLAGTRITDAGVARLAGLDHLESLDLTIATRVTDASVPHLLGMTSLTHLEVVGTAISEAGYADLSRSPSRAMVIYAR